MISKIAPTTMAIVFDADAEPLPGRGAAVG
jgi:hypothetical protein